MLLAFFDEMPHEPHASLPRVRLLSDRFHIHMLLTPARIETLTQLGYPDIAVMQLAQRSLQQRDLSGNLQQSRATA